MWNKNGELRDTKAIIPVLVVEHDDEIIKSRYIII